MDQISNGKRVGRPPLGRWDFLTVRVTSDTHSALRSIAQNRGISINEIVNERLREPNQHDDIVVLIRRELARVGLMNLEQKKTSSMRELSTASALDEGHSKPLEGVNHAESSTTD